MLLPCNVTFLFSLFPDCMIGTYGVLKLPVISNFLPSPTVTVLMTMLEEKLVSNYFANIFFVRQMKTVPTTVKQKRCNLTRFFFC